MNGADMQRSVMDGGSRKGQAGWNISSETGLRRESVGVVENSRVRDIKSCRCLALVGIPACARYSIPLWIKLET